MKRPTTKAPIPLSQLPNNAMDFRKILDLYLNLLKPFKNETKYDHVTFYVQGTGHDGQKQTLLMDKQGRIRRHIIDCDHPGKWQVIQLPAETGKVLYMLKSMGYELSGEFHFRAVRYQKYSSTGISNLNNFKESSIS